MGVPKASRLQVIPHRSGMPGHVDDVGWSSPITGDATITAITSRGAQENHLACEERVIASSVAGEAAEYVGSTDGPFLPQSPDGHRLHQEFVRREGPVLSEPPCHPSRLARQARELRLRLLVLATGTEYACSSEWVKGTSAAQ
jgi:hypothetical protein